MRKDRLYLLTFLALTLIFILIAAVGIRYVIKISANEFIQTQLESSKREAKEMASLIGSQLASGIDKETIIQNVQTSIEDTDTENGFICMFDWSGKEICNPDKTRVGQMVSPNQSFVKTMDGDIDPEDFYDILAEKKAFGGIRDFGEEELGSEIIYLYPVANSDWIIGAHANMSNISGRIESMRNKFYVIFVIMGFAIILSSVVTVRFIGSAYEKRLETRTQDLEKEVVNLAKLNRDLDRYQQKVGVTANDDKGTMSEVSKQRILTYVRNELVPISTEEIAYIYTESTITYVVCFDGRRSTSGSSLDDLLASLDNRQFYRANRQFIIAISAIEKIIKYGNNQLKILVNPNSELDIIISKNKAAEFKQWLNL